MGRYFLIFCFKTNMRFAILLATLACFTSSTRLMLAPRRVPRNRVQVNQGQSLFQSLNQGHVSVKMALLVPQSEYKKLKERKRRRRKRREAVNHAHAKLVLMLMSLQLES